MKMLNIGCGGIFHPEWTNVDMVSNSPHVLARDIRRGLPFPSSSFDVVFHSHVLEHFSLEEAGNFLEENFRVLKPGGILRIVVPDLENIARTYLAQVDRLAGGDVSAKSDHEWMILELFDQCVRHQTGGEMGKFIRARNASELSFAYERLGQEIDLAKEPPGEAQAFFQKLIKKRPSFFSNYLRKKCCLFFVSIVGGKEAAVSFREGSFRNSGEVHKWMYDLYSLKNLLEAKGFEKTQRFSESESQIPRFSQFELELVNGRIRKPQSLILESRKKIS